MCIHKVLHEILENWHSQYHVRWIFCHDSNFSCFCMLSLCWPATLTIPDAVVLGPHHCKHGIHSILSQTQVHCPDAWCFSQLFYFLHNSPLFSVHFWVFFLHSISATGTTSLLVDQSLADYDYPLVLQTLIANLSIFLCLFTESMGRCLQLWFMFWALLYVCRLFLNII